MREVGLPVAEWTMWTILEVGRSKETALTLEIISSLLVSLPRSDEGRTASKDH